MLTLDDRTGKEHIKLKPAGRYAARAIAADPDGDPLSYRWMLRRESEATQVGGDPEEVPEMIPGRLQEAADGRAILSAPERAGVYRLFVSIYDGNGNAGHANIPFLVE